MNDRRMDGWMIDQKYGIDIMKHLAAYLLLTAGGKANPSAEDIKKLLSSVGIEADEERLNSLIAALQDKNINEVQIALHCIFIVVHGLILSQH